MNVHLERILVDIRHVFFEFLLQHVFLYVLRNTEQLTYVRPVHPVIEQLRASVNVFADELG